MLKVMILADAQSFNKVTAINLEMLFEKFLFEYFLHIENTFSLCVLQQNHVCFANWKYFTNRQLQYQPY